MEDKVISTVPVEGTNGKKYVVGFGYNGDEFGVITISDEIGEIWKDGEFITPEVNHVIGAAWSKAGA